MLSKLFFKYILSIHSKFCYQTPESFKNIFISYLFYENNSIQRRIIQKEKFSFNSEKCVNEIFYLL